MEPNDYHVHKATCWAGWLLREDNWAKTEGKECCVTSYIKLWFISHPTQMANPHVQSPQSHFLADNPPWEHHHSFFTITTDKVVTVKLGLNQRNRAACASASTLEIDVIDSLLGGWCMLKSAKLGPEKLLVVLDEWAIVRPNSSFVHKSLSRYHFWFDIVHIKRSHRLQEGRYCIVDMLFSLFSLSPLDN